MKKEAANDDDDDDDDDSDDYRDDDDDDSDNYRDDDDDDDEKKKTEKYRLSFTDSYRFMLEKLSNLVDNLSGINDTECKKMHGNLEIKIEVQMCRMWK